MAQSTREGISASLGQLIDGFVALSDEYKRLAGKHHVLQNHLSAATEEFAKLRGRYTDEPLLKPSREREEQLRLDEPEPAAGPIRNLSECLEAIRGSTDASVQEAITRIRDGEMACFGLQNRINDGTADSVYSSRHPSLPIARARLNRNNPGLHQHAQYEQDFTVPGKPSNLQCPLATWKAPRQSNLCPVPGPDHNLPTPRDSTSQVTPTRKSINDPIKPDSHRDTQEDVITETSEEGSDGPTCPIRFLDQHSPEEIAKYFEEHKHELPRSHEECVKRFQTNADSIKELDKKYGNLVSMIQGLGQKHQPMLPETPDPEANGVEEDEDRKVNKRVKKWAKAVSSGPRNSNQDGEEDQGNEGENALDAETGEERVSHFDRPLKEIRVGESPSRPWGVPIPAQYLDRTVSKESVPKPPAAASAPTPGAPIETETAVPIKVKVSRAREANLESAHQTKKPEKPSDSAPNKGKCPFDHKAMLAGKMPTAAAAAAEAKDFAPQQEKEKEEPPILAEEPPKSQVRREAGKPRGHIINNGIAFVADSKLLGSQTFENKGTLLVGYSAEQASSLLQQLGK